MLYVTRILELDAPYIADARGVNYDVFLSDTKTGRVGVFSVESLRDRGVLGLEFDKEGKCILIVVFDVVSAKFQEFVKGISVVEMSDDANVEEAYLVTKYDTGLSTLVNPDADRLRYDLPSGDWGMNFHGVVEWLDSVNDADWQFMPLFRFIYRICEHFKVNIFKFSSIAFYSYDENIKYLVYLNRSPQAETFFTKAYLSAGAVT